MLFAAGIADRQYTPQDDVTLPELGIGFTNLCTRPTRRAGELTREEIRAGAEALRATIERYGPRATSKVAWGVQPGFTVHGVTGVVVPSPSGLNRMCFEELVDHYLALASFLKQQDLR